MSSGWRSSTGRRRVSDPGAFQIHPRQNGVMKARHVSERSQDRVPYVVLDPERHREGHFLDHNGEELILDGSNDVDSSISGISISDPTLGQVKLDWQDFDRVVFHGTNDENQFVDFDGGRRIQGTVLTESGDEIKGEISWDNDESYTWEMLDGDIRNIEFKIEFSNIDRIEKARSGAKVTLKDGREFNLTDSNDVDDGNRGITIRDNGRTYEVEWDDFRELRIIY